MAMKARRKAKPAKAAKAKRKAAKPAKKAKKAKKATKVKARKKAPAKRAVAKKAKRPAAKAKKAKSRTTPKTKDVIGEGNYTASRNFRKAETRFIDNNRDTIVRKAKEAEAALDGPEGAALERAREETAAHAKE